MRFKQLYEFKEFNGTVFLKLLHHNSTYKQYFNSKNVYFNLAENTYSILGLLDDSFKIPENESFEFILEYPEFSDKPYDINPIIFLFYRN